MTIPIQNVPAVVLPSAFPTTADRVAGVYNAKARAWADSEAAMATCQHEIALVTHNNAQAAHQRAQAAEQARADAVAQTAEIKQSMLVESGAILDQTIAARDAAVVNSSLAQALANFKGRWQSLSGALVVPASVWHAGNYWSLISNVPSVAAAEPGLSNAWAMVGTQVHRLGYEQRGQLRTLGYPGLQWAMVDGLGMFFFEAGSIEPDDDESCFLTAEGAWLLQCPSMDAVAYWLRPWQQLMTERLDVQQALRITASSPIASLAAGAKASFAVSLPESSADRCAIVSPPADLESSLWAYARVTGHGEVTIYLHNASAAAASVSSGDWRVTVL